jgi:hypothetical protein
MDMFMLDCCDATEPIPVPFWPPDRQMSGKVLSQHPNSGSFLPAGALNWHIYPLQMGALQNCIAERIAQIARNAEAGDGAKRQVRW